MLWYNVFREIGTVQELLGHKGLAQPIVGCSPVQTEGGSLHYGKGEKFKLSDVPRAIECIQRIPKPCIGYKIMGSGRIEARMAFEHAFDGIKSTDVVKVGMFLGHSEDIVEENVAMAQEILSGS